MERIFTLDDINVVASDFWNYLANKKIFAFHGEIGSGKTTFIHALCEEKKVKDVVSSPTYAIINEYKYEEGYIFHIDLYRLRDEEEALEAGIKDCLYSENICFVEWPERAPAIFPDETINIFIEALDESTRRIRIDEN